MAHEMAKREEQIECLTEASLPTGSLEDKEV
jgi:hypothetical protein